MSKVLAPEHASFEIRDGELVFVGEQPGSKAEAYALVLEKWYFIRSHLDEISETGGGYTCAFCTLYFDHYCDGCPIAQQSGHLMCGGTPYRAFVSALGYKDREKAAQSLEDEIAFLESLTIDE